jgi:hypothetical protein
MGYLAGAILKSPRIIQQKAHEKAARRRLLQYIPAN